MDDQSPQENGTDPQQVEIETAAVETTTTTTTATNEPIDDCGQEKEDEQQQPIITSIVTKPSPVRHMTSSSLSIEKTIEL